MLATAPTGLRVTTPIGNFSVTEGTFSRKFRALAGNMGTCCHTLKAVTPSLACPSSHWTPQRDGGLYLPKMAAMCSFTM